MEIPKSVKLYCPKCDSHTSHKLKQFKQGKARAMAWGNRKMVAKHKRGYGGKAKFTKLVKKQTKTPAFLAECEKCHKKVYWSLGKRIKKAELK
ncbi:MAG: 50S ribosomal protein L44e [archaeon]